MNVVVNGRFLGRPITGVERYAYEILFRLPDKPQIVQPDSSPAKIYGHIWEQLTLPRLIGPGQTLWSPANTGPVNVKNQVLTLHDLSPLEHPEWYQPAFAAWYRLFLPALVRRVRHIVVSSGFVKAKIVRRFRLLDDHITVIPGGVDNEMFYPDAERKTNLPEHYILFVGSLQPRKNLARLINAWNRIKESLPDIWLVIAGSTSSIFGPISLPDSERVSFLGSVPDEDLPGLYAGAELFVLPSLDEGFGLPVLEAMACGTPVTASRAGALPEVVGDVGLVFDPLDELEFTNSLLRGLTDKALRKSLREQGLKRVMKFSWQNAADKLWEVFEACQ